jgi:penicillin-binding protein 1A
VSKIKKKQKKSIKKRVVKLFAFLIIFSFLAITTVTLAFIMDSPSLDEELLKDAQSSLIYDKNNEEVMSISGAETRTIVKIDDIPKVVQDAFISVEDVRFKEHIGIDLKRILGAIYANVTKGFGSEGASTITQQVIKNSFLTSEKSLKRKIQEQYLAIQLEQKYTKNEILEMYLNKIYFAKGAYGISAAAKTYFGKTIDQLEIHEAALLAGIPQRPNLYNPFKNPDIAKERRNTVLNLMAKHGFITKAEAEIAKATDVTASLRAQDDEQYDYHDFLRQVMNEIEDYASSNNVEINIHEGGLKIYTTLDQEAQREVEQMLNVNTDTFPDDNFQAAIVLLDSKTSAIRAIGGGIKQKNIDFANNKRQPGSTIKPILDYGPAIEHFKWSTATLINDEPYQYSFGKKVENWNKKYKGFVTVREALQYSLNIPAVKTFQQVGKDKARAFATSLGIPLDEQFGEPYSIGGFRTGVTPIQLAGAYSTFANRGNFNEPHAVTKIVFPDGEEISFLKEEKRVMSEATAFMITDMLKTVVRAGTGTNARIQGLPLAGKTGTTNLPKETGITSGVRDSWFAGYSTSYTAAVWTGYNVTNEKQYIKPRNIQIAANLFKQLMKTVHEGMEVDDFHKPSTVISVTVEKPSTLLPSEYTPKDEIIRELFISGTEPKIMSTLYQQVDQPTLDGTYNRETEQVIIEWSHPSILNEDEETQVVFDVFISIDEGPYQNLYKETDSLTHIVNEPIKGAIYKFMVVAKAQKNVKNISIPVELEIEIPKPIIDWPIFQ